SSLAESASAIAPIGSSVARILASVASSQEPIRTGTLSQPRSSAILRRRWPSISRPVRSLNKQAPAQPTSAITSSRAVSWGAGGGRELHGLSASSAGLRHSRRSGGRASIFGFFFAIPAILFLRFCCCDPGYAPQPAAGLFGWHVTPRYV